MGPVRGLFRRFFSVVRKNEHNKIPSSEIEPSQNVDSPFMRLFRERHSLWTYKIVEDDFRRLSRSSKVSFIGLSTFLVVPGGFALLTTPSTVVNDLILHQFKLSSVTLSWLSASVLVFHLVRFNTSVITIAWSMLGLFGSAASLIIRDYSATYGYACLLSSYAAFALVNSPYGWPSFRRYGNGGTSYSIGSLTLPLRASTSACLPVSVAKPVIWTACLNIALLLVTAMRSSYVENELSNTSHEEFIRRYEAKHGIER